MAGYVLLEDGTRFDGDACGADVHATGEVVFTTGMSGYQESMTDPSFARQLITFTYPHIGNYGVERRRDGVRSRVGARGDHARGGRPHRRARRRDRLADLAASEGVPAITGVDTRALVRHIRSAGAMRGGLFPARIPEDEARALIDAEPPMAGLDLAREVTPAELTVHGDGDVRIAAIDTGIKSSIVRNLVARGARVELHPCTVTAEEIAATEPDAVFLANGPGDPAALGYVVDTLRELVGPRPVFGICLGHQLLSRAVGLDTFKLPFGHRGANHPVKDLETGRIEITSQNHGFAVRRARRRAPRRQRPARALVDRLRRRGPQPRQPLRPHGRGPDAARRPGRHRPVPPEAGPGPHDSLYLFDRFLDQIRAAPMPRRDDLQRIMILGSGPIVIGQAAEFDYSGVQACKVLKEEGYEIVLVNSNPATIMTDPEFADATYVEPLLPGPVAQVIERERPDALLPTLGGQTALNLAKALHEDGTLERFGVELIGADYDAIARAEDRDLFRQTMDAAGLKMPRSAIATSVEQALGALGEVGLPCIVRPAFTLGGRGGGVARTEEEYRTVVARGLAASPIGQVLLDQSVLGWGEFELEVMRDRNDNVVIVCSIENIDPMGVHTGDSVTVAPQQTLTDRLYQQLRDQAIAVIRAVGVETGGSNVQFAVDPATEEILVIEMNPRVSRSSALASKATGFPIAKIAARLAVGYALEEIPNDITKLTPASFEPTIDYVVVKWPRFAFEKFPGVTAELTTHMKSVGEAMAIGRTFGQAFGKALRSRELDIATRFEALDAPTLLAALEQPASTATTSCSRPSARARRSTRSTSARASTRGSCASCRRWRSTPRRPSGASARSRPSTPARPSSRPARRTSTRAGSGAPRTRSSAASARA